jgi:hypothetical protein
LVNLLINCISPHMKHDGVHPSFAILDQHNILYPRLFYTASLISNTNTHLVVTYYSQVVANSVFLLFTPEK